VIALHARSLSPTAQAWLSENRPVWVFHLSARACNLIDAQDRVLALVTEQIGDGPFNVVVPPTIFPLNVTPESSVDLAPDSIRVGSLIVDLSDAVPWNPLPDWPRLRVALAQVESCLPLLRATLCAHAPPASLAALVVDLPAPSSAVEVALLQTARDHWSALAYALENGDREGSLESAAGLAGLGDGLTPAGDDWLLGAALAAHLKDPSDPARELFLEAARGAARRTTPLSAAWLRAAASGECAAPWHELFESCLGADEEAIEHAAHQIIGQGHTSGASALAGFVEVLSEKEVQPKGGSDHSARSRRSRGTST
jgi:hypothetical protein